MDAPVWEEMYDKMTGAVYYLHMETGETSWEKPEGFVSGLIRDSSSEESSSEDEVSRLHILFKFHKMRIILIFYVKSYYSYLISYH